MSTALRFSAPAGSSWLPWIVSTGRPTLRLGSAKLTRLRRGSRQRVGVDCWEAERGGRAGVQVGSHATAVVWLR